MSLRVVTVSLLATFALAACDQRSVKPPSQPPQRGDSPAASARAPTQSPQESARPLPDVTSDRQVLIEPARGLGGVLPLKHGVFVLSETACNDPPNAALRRYDGEGLSGAHTHACRIRILARRGASYDIEQSCIDRGQGPGPRSIETATLDIQDNLTFVMKGGGAGETFRYCAAAMLPASLRN